LRIAYAIARSSPSGKLAFRCARNASNVAGDFAKNRRPSAASALMSSDVARSRRIAVVPRVSIGWIAPRSAT
jgi:hypothetical protein